MDHRRTNSAVSAATGIVKPTRKGGRRSSPHPSLLGRTAVCAILGKDRKALRRYEEEKRLLPVVTEDDGTRWYSAAAVGRFAKKLREEAVAKALANARRGFASKALIEPCNGEETRLINAAFDANMPHRDICSTFRKSNETIRYMYDQYRTPSGGKRPRATKAKEDLPTPREYGEYHPERERDYLQPERLVPREDPIAGAARPPTPAASVPPASSSRTPAFTSSKPRKVYPIEYASEDFQGWDATPPAAPQVDPPPKARKVRPASWATDDLPPPSER